MIRSSLALACLIAIAFAAPAGATSFTINVSLDGSQAGVASPATGSAVLTLDDVANSLNVNMTYSGLLGTVSDAHIHCCSLPGVSSGVIIPFVPPMTTGATSGSFINLFSLSPTQVAQVKSGLAYINIHTTFASSGEIRGQIAAVPEPGTLALLGFGLASLDVGRRRLRRVGGASR